jgi:HAD superfamily hydrolase (TIGR01549 family)
MYQAEYDMTPEQTDWAGRLWAEYQLQDVTPVPMYNGVETVLKALQHFPQGIVSQNARSNIIEALQAQGIAGYFACIIGFEEVDIRRQKPEPDGLLWCIKELTGFSPGYVVYIGDHETDVRCAQNAGCELHKNDLDIQVISIGICHDDMTNPTQWKFVPDHTASSPEDIIHIVKRLS